MKFYCNFVLSCVIMSDKWIATYYDLMKGVDSANTFRYISAFPDSKYFGPIFNKLVTIVPLVAQSHPSSIPWTSRCPNEFRPILVVKKSSHGLLINDGLKPSQTYVPWLYLVFFDVHFRHEIGHPQTVLLMEADNATKFFILFFFLIF